MLCDTHFIFAIDAFCKDFTNSRTFLDIGKYGEFLPIITSQYTSYVKKAKNKKGTKRAIKCKVKR